MTISKREQEVQKQLLETTAKQKLPQRQPSPPVTTPVSAPVQPPPIVAPQANTHITQAIETVMRNVKLEEEHSCYREKLAAKGNSTPGTLLKGHDICTESSKTRLKDFRKFKNQTEGLSKQAV